MLTDEKNIELKKLMVKPGKTIKLKDFDTEYIPSIKVKP